MNETDLLSQHCVEYPAGTPPLPPAEVERYLARVPGWRLEDSVVRRGLLFSDFRSLIAFINRLADLAEEEQHHPDFLVYGYRRMRIDFATHSLGGLSLNDFIMAAKVSRLLESEDVQKADREP
jgi:4a-hydroxytetrahydrobiopterin dehydratase